MRKVTLGLFAFLLTSILPIVAAQDQTQSKMAASSRSFAGEIMDAACAKMGSHDQMMKQEGATSAKDCSDKCVQGGSKYVLYDKNRKRTYALDDQNKAKQYSGQQVTVKGSFDRATRSIKIDSIEAAS